MKISGINNIQNENFANKTDGKIEQKALEIKNNKEIASNSLSEAIGRSQVAFKGINKVDKNGVFKHECVEKGAQENITYDPKTGNFKHESFSKKGEFISSIEYNNATQTRIITEKKDNGNTEVITDVRGTKTTQIFNEKGNPLKEIIEPSIGSPKTTTWDYKKGRKLVTEFENTRVFDLKSGKEIFFGDLVYADKLDRIKNKRSTYNVRTGSVIKDRLYDKKDRLIDEIDYDETTGKIIKRTEYGKKEGEYRISEYDKKTFRLISDVQSTNKGRNVRTKTFDPYTGKITSNYEEVFSGDILVKEIEYYADSDRAKTIKEYNEETCEISHFGYNGNIEKFEVLEDGNPIRVDLYSKTSGKKAKTIYTDYKNNKKIIDSYTPKGNVFKRIVQSTLNDFIQEETVFYPNGNPRETHKWNEFTNECCTEQFNEYGIRTRKVEKDRNQKVRRETNYYSDGETKKNERYYYMEGDSVYTEYDENGETINTTCYDKYGRKEDFRYQSSSSKSNNYDFSSNKTSQTSTDDKREAKINFLNKILNAISSRRTDDFFKINNKEWRTLAKILGSEDYTLLQEGDKKECLRLIKIYHPDICEDKEFGDIATKILNALKDSST